MNMNRVLRRIPAWAASIILAVTVGLSGCAAEEADTLAILAPEPLIYSTGGQVFMACGEKSVCLSGVQVMGDDDDKTIRAEISEDNSTLIYISDYDDETSTGTLMGAHTDCLTQPYLIDTGVYTAEMSQNGARVLLIKNVADNVGDLYLYSGDGNPQYVTGGVSPENLGFSLDAKTICFEKEGKLFIQEDEQQAAEAADVSNVTSLYVMNGGRLLYQTGYYIYYYSDGRTQIEAENIKSNFKVQRGANTFVYQTSEGLFSKEPGREAKLLTEERWGLFIEYQYPGSFMKSVVMSNDSQYFFGDSFLIVVQTSAEQILYGQQLNKDKSKITASYDGVIIDHRFNNVAFQILEEDGPKTFLCSKKDEVWSEPKKIFDFPFAINIGDSLEFDSDDRMIYCLEHHYSKLKGGFWRYDIEKDKAEKLMDGATGFYLIRDTAYVYTKDALWKITEEGANVKIMDYAANRYDDVFFETQGGAFFVTAANDIYYIKDEQAEMTEIYHADWVINPFWILRDQLGGL